MRRLVPSLCLLAYMTTLVTGNEVKLASICCRAARIPLTKVAETR